MLEKCAQTHDSFYKREKLASGPRSEIPNLLWTKVGVQEKGAKYKQK